MTLEQMLKLLAIHQIMFDFDWTPILIKHKCSILFEQIGTVQLTGNDALRGMRAREKLERVWADFKDFQAKPISPESVA